MSAAETELTPALPLAARRARPIVPALLRGHGAAVVVAAAVAAGIAVRFVQAGPLWFDEAQSVAIARLPLHGLFAALRQDGSPPLYYLLLHGWIDAFGAGTTAVRALSGLCSVAALPPAWLLARRIDRRAAAPALVLLATSPMAIRYALEVRMYALEPLLIALGGLALLAMLERPTRARGAGLALCSGALALTHYWALFLLAAVAIGLLPRALRGSSPHQRALAALLGGAVVFAPWLPSMLFQLRHTGTPWSHAAVYDALEALPAWGGADEVTDGLVAPTAAAFVPLLMLLVLAAPFRARRGGRLAALALGTALLGGLASTLVHSAIVPRYLTVGLLPYLLAAAVTVAALPRRWGIAVLIVAAALGIATGYRYGVAPRTMAARVVHALRRHGRAADALVFCPDQLGPDVVRLLPGWRDALAYPSGGRPVRVDWIDYSARNLRSSPARYARAAVAAAPRRPVWLLAASGFSEYHGRCGQLARALSRLRPGRRRLLTGRNPMDLSQREALVEYLP